jgi:hypothetical protein
MFSVKLVTDGYFSDEPLPNDEMANVNDKVFFNHTILNEISDSGDNLNVHPTGDEGIAVSVAPDPIPISVDTERINAVDLMMKVCGMIYSYLREKSSSVLLSFSACSFGIH